MRIKHIKTTKEGEPMANPETHYPDKSKYVPDYDNERAWYKALAKYYSGLLPFEDRELANVYAILSDTGYKPDTLIPVDLEVEVVDVFTKEEMLKIAQGDGFGVSSAYVPSKNKVLRIKN